MSGPQWVRYTIDSIEDGRAALLSERGVLLLLPAGQLPEGAREGDVLRLDVANEAPGEHAFVIDPEETQARRAEAEARLTRLRARDPGGDLEL